MCVKQYILNTNLDDSACLFEFIYPVFFTARHREVNKNNLPGGQFLIFLPKTPEK